MNIGLGWRRYAGLVWIEIGCYNVHLIVRWSHRQWPVKTGWYDGPLYSVGIWPLFLVAW